MSVIAQYELPFSILDYGLTALALVAIVAISYLFTKVANSQHQKGAESFERIGEVLENLTSITRQVASEMQDTKQELARVHEEVWRNRETILHGQEMMDRVDRKQSDFERERHQEHTDIQRAIERGGGKSVNPK